MYAVIQSGGKQYRVAKGQTLKLETLPADVGAAVHFDNVMMVASEGNVQIGTPYIKGGKVSAKVISQGRHKKIRIIKFRRRKHYEKQQGHRQNFTEVEITDITS